MINKDQNKTFYEANRVIEKADDYIYLLPHPGLRDWISNYTLTFPSRNMISDEYTVVPHGSATLVFSCDEKGICSQLFGPATLPCMVGYQANQSDMLFIIEFQPAGLYAFTGVNQKELSNQTIHFELIKPMLCKLIMEILEKSRSMYELFACLDRLLLSSLQTSCPPELRYSVQSIIENMGSVSVKDLSGGVFYSRRHFNRIFDHYVGMSAKTFSRIVRINKAVRLLHNPRNTITNACNLSGFYDLSHFMRDFKSVCGLTPQEYRDKMSHFYSEIAKF